MNEKKMIRVKIQFQDTAIEFNYNIYYGSKDTHI